MKQQDETPHSKQKRLKATGTLVYITILKYMYLQICIMSQA